MNEPEWMDGWAVAQAEERVLCAGQRCGFAVDVGQPLTSAKGSYLDPSASYLDGHCVFAAAAASVLLSSAVLLSSCTRLPIHPP